MSGDPILVVGARTTGLTMALGLARAGVAVRIIDKGPGIDPHCRANLLHSRSVEILHDLGLAEAVEAASVRVVAMNQFVDGERVYRQELGEVDSPFPWSLALSQAETEAILLEGLRALGGDVEWRTELVDMVQNERDVRAVLRRPDGKEEQIHTPWLIGCDGAHSVVRHLNREGFPGEGDPRHYLIADVVVDSDIPLGEANTYLTSSGVVFFFPLPEGRNLVVGDLSPEDPPSDEAPTLDEVQAMVNERGPAGTTLSASRWNTYFRIHYRLAEHYRHDRAFLLGDAAHVHSPVGGYGMNTGIQDAYNLSWKLALVVQQRTRDAEQLLDSYETERRAVARDVLAATQAVTESVFELAHLPKAEQRRILAGMIVTEPERLRAADHRETLDLDYRRSPICTDNVPTDHRTGVHAGAQAPDAGPLEWAGERGSLFDVLRGPKHSLLVFPGPPGGDDRASQAVVDSLAAHEDLIVPWYVMRTSTGSVPPGLRSLIDLEGALARRYDVLEPTYYLIRPDGHVGFRCVPARPERLRAYLARTF